MGWEEEVARLLRLQRMRRKVALHTLRTLLDQLATERAQRARESESDVATSLLDVRSQLLQLTTENTRSQVSGMPIGYTNTSTMAVLRAAKYTSLEQSTAKSARCNRVPAARM